MRDVMGIRSQWTRAGAANREAAERYADQIMRDTRWDRLRSLRARRALVIAFVALLALTGALYLSGLSLIGLLVLVLTIATWVLLRLAVRTIADLPDEYLDERQASVRDRAYLESYRLLGGLVAVALSGLLLWVIVAADTSDVALLSVAEDAALGVLWVGLGLVLGLPSIVLAWNEPEV
jgi:hypothetical protein